MQLPLVNAHRNHIVSEKTRNLGRTHPCIIRKIEEFVLGGVLRAPELRKLVSQYSKHVLCPNLNIKYEENNPYYSPTTKNCGNHLRNIARRHGITLPKKPVNPNARKRIRKKKTPLFIF